MGFFCGCVTLGLIGLSFGYEKYLSRLTKLVQPIWWGHGGCNHIMSNGRNFTLMADEIHCHYNFVSGCLRAVRMCIHFNIRAANKSLSNQDGKTTKKNAHTPTAATVFLWCAMKNAHKIIKTNERQLNIVELLKYPADAFKVISPFFTFRLSFGFFFLLHLSHRV